MFTQSQIVSDNLSADFSMAKEPHQSASSCSDYNSPTKATTADNIQDFESGSQTRASYGETWNEEPNNSNHSTETDPGGAKTA